MIADDEDLLEQIIGGRLLGPERAAQYLEIRRVDFGYLVAAGWVQRSSWGESHVSRRKVVRVPLYRVADLQTARQIPGIVLRAVQPGEPSPLKEFAQLPIARAALVRGFAAGLAARHDISVGVFYDGQHDSWELEWLTREDGSPNEDSVRAALRVDRDLAVHVQSITVQAAANTLRHEFDVFNVPGANNESVIGGNG